MRADAVRVPVREDCLPAAVTVVADPQAVIIRPGYLDGHWTGAWTDRGVRDEVGATARKQAAVSLPAGRGRA